MRTLVITIQELRLIQQSCPAVGKGQLEGQLATGAYSHLTVHCRLSIILKS